MHVLANGVVAAAAAALLTPYIKIVVPSVVDAIVERGQDAL
jgi:hypothetical protein